MAVIETSDLRKRFDAVQALDGLSLRVEEGEVYGLLGPNGAGKSTLMHLLLGFLRPDRGRIRVFGAAPSAARNRVGYLPERVRYHTHLTPREYLHALGTFSNLHGKDLKNRCQSLLELVGLAKDGDRRMSGFSKGMLQRVGIAQALVHEPDLLLIDEPTSGLDPAGQREVLDLLTELRRRKHTILMCTHQIAEVKQLCDRMGILSGGRLAAEARVDDLMRARGVTITVREQSLPPKTAAQLQSLAPAVQTAGRGVQVQDDEALQRQVLRTLLDADLTVAELRPTGDPIEDLFVRVTVGKLATQVGTSPEDPTVAVPVAPMGVQR
ncbi:MAG: ABC transporter ATP-binding protein, partial [Chloroflexota bacterium]